MFVCVHECMRAFVCVHADVHAYLLVRACLHVCMCDFVPLPDAYWGTVTNSLHSPAAPTLKKDQIMILVQQTSEFMCLGILWLH